MITSYYVFEEYMTGLINYNGIPLKLDVDYSNGVTNVTLMYSDSVYDELSVSVPDSDELDRDEFFLNPDIDKKLVDKLVSQGFIESSGKHTSYAGKYKVKSYKLV